MRYFIVFYESAYAKGCFEFPALKYPPRKWLLKQVQAVIKREGGDGLNGTITNIIELSKEDYESWIGGV